MQTRRNIVTLPRVKRRIHSLIAAPCVLLLAAATMSSCQKETAIARANREKILLVGNADDPKSLDLDFVSSVIDGNIQRAIFEGLTADDATRDNVSQPGVATHWEHNADFTQWTFHLRPDAKWSDGQPLSSDDFLFAYERILSPDTASPYAEMLYFLRDAEDFNRGKIKEFSRVGVKALDAHTLQFTLREPVPFLPSVTRHFTWFPLPKHVVLRHGSISDRLNPWSKAENIVSNGAFKIRSWKLGDAIETEKNPHYWDVKNVELNGIRFLPIENFFTETRAFLADQLHTTYQLPPDLVDKMKRDYPNVLRQEPYVGNSFVRINTTRKALQDLRVRQALSLAIDRQALCREVMIGYQPATSLTPPMAGYQTEPMLNFDLAKARQLLAEAGYPDGRNFPRLRLMVRDTGARQVPQALQEMWKQNLGVYVDLEPKDTSTYMTSQERLEYDMVIAGWVGDYLDPSTFLLMWTKGNGNNNTGWSSEKFETILNEAAHEPTPEARLARLSKAEAVLMSELPVIPFSWQARNYLLHPSVKGWHPLLLDNHPWKAVRLVPTP